MLKKSAFIAVVFIALFSVSCKTEYVATKPEYVEVSRPAQPTPAHIWMDGEWVWNRGTRTYTRVPGYWVVPNGRTYVPGYWVTTNRGNRWRRGYWR